MNHWISVAVQTPAHSSVAGPLTYRSELPLPPGTLVRAPLGSREVLGIELGDVPQTDIAAGFAEASGWVACGPEDGAVGWMAWRDGAPSHCGIVLPGGSMLHSQGIEGHGGSVRVTRLAILRRLYSDITYHRPC